MDIDHAYELLQLPRNSSIQEVRKKFQTLIKHLHPDINSNHKDNELYKKYSLAKSLIEEDKKILRNPFELMHPNFEEEILNWIMN